MRSTYIQGKIDVNNILFDLEAFIVMYSLLTLLDIFFFSQFASPLLHVGTKGLRLNPPTNWISFQRQALLSTWKYSSLASLTTVRFHVGFDGRPLLRIPWVFYSSAIALQLSSRRTVLAIYIRFTVSCNLINFFTFGQFLKAFVGCIWLKMFAMYVKY